MNTMSRKAYLDYAKGIGAMCVIVGHMTTYPRGIRSAIYTFHIPLFFIITGILFYYRPISKDFKSYAKGKVKRILLPAFFFELVMYVWIIIKNFIEPGYDLSGLVKRFFGIFLQIVDSDFCGNLWFFPTYFLAVLCMYFVLKLDKKSYPGLTVVLIGFSYVLAYILPELYLPWHIEIVPACMGYMTLGYILAGIYGNVKSNKKIYRVDIDLMNIIGGGIVWILCYLLYGNHYDLYSHTFGNLILDTLMATAGTVVIIIACKYVDRSEMFPKCCKNVLNFIGQNSMEFYGVHAIMVGILNTIIRHFISEGVLYSWPGIFISLFSLMVSIVVDSIMICIYKKLYSKIVK